MHGWMRRSNIQRNIFAIQNRSVHTIVVVKMDGQNRSAMLLSIGFVIFAQGMTDELMMSQNTAQVGVTGKVQTKHIVSFALEPVGTRPYVGGGLDAFAFADGTFN